MSFSTYFFTGFLEGVFLEEMFLKDERSQEQPRIRGVLRFNYYVIIDDPCYK